jgi:hypothetical protein
MPVRNGKVGGGRTAASPQRRAGKATATKRKGKVRGYDARRELALARVREEQARVDAWIASQSGHDAVAGDQRVDADHRGEEQAAQDRLGVPLPRPGADRPDEHQADEPRHGDTVAAGDLIEVHFGTLVEVRDDDDLPMDVDSICKRLDWSMGEARHLVRQGYDIPHVVAITGWPASRLDDVRIGKWA